MKHSTKVATATSKDAEEYVQTSLWNQRVMDALDEVGTGDHEVGLEIVGQSDGACDEIVGPFTKRGLAARFMVRKEDAEAAVELLAELRED